jgi:hypothetical protein
MLEEGVLLEPRGERLGRERGVVTRFLASNGRRWGWSDEQIHHLVVVIKSVKKKVRVNSKLLVGLWGTKKKLNQDIQLTREPITIPEKYFKNRLHDLTFNKCRCDIKSE